jgi:predicted membrane GTPase involved in stress response
VFGRGILHLSILVETMRREGYEFQLGQPQVLYKDIDGQRHEPIEMLTVQVPEHFSSRVIDHVTRRKGEIMNIEQKSDRTVLEFSIPARGIIGLRNTAAHRHRGRGHHRPPLQGLRAVQRRTSQRPARAASSAPRPVRPSPTPSTNCRTAASSSSPPAKRSMPDR